MEVSLGLFDEIAAELHAIYNAGASTAITRARESGKIPRSREPPLEKHKGESLGWESGGLSSSMMKDPLPTEK
jgi:hypothetical protein